MQQVFDFFTPAPLSPLFQANGMFAGFNEDATFTLLFMALLFVIDNLFVKNFIAPKGRYFALHVIANSISATAAFPDVVRAFTGDPRTLFNGPSHTMVANSAVAAIHLYHCVAFPLRAEDIFHHLTFVSILCGLAVPFKHVGGIGNNFGCFPLRAARGIDYVLLTCVSQGWMHKMTEKIWSVRINVWLRGPSMSFYTMLGWLSFWHDPNRQCHSVILFLIVALHFYNGQFYAQQSVESCTTQRIQAKMEQQKKE